ncbi:hypothetical protein HRI_003585300 [Hibiscus trionum]|uniref:EamA domain-containing protein n=1 Tax=Hibiscus trionum TaxID=183268 RepID=A0A9W7IPW2_HIBTR|nr:hypothetical protein HRI_003585300 [Hibiscus trionum]
MAPRMYCYNHILPFAAMVGVEAGNVVVNILFKASTSSAMMSYYVFITYSYAIATLVLLPLPFIFYSGAVVSPFKFHLFSRLCLLGLIGFLAQICSYKGIEYSSPTLASAVANLSPAFTFILAVIFRMEKVALRSTISQAKIMGTIVSISGALVVVLYKGPKLFSSSSDLHQWPLESSESDWLIGGVLIAVAYLLYSFFYIILTQVMQVYKQEFSIALFYNLCATVIAMPVSLMAQPNITSWNPTPTLVFLTVLYSGIFSSISSSVHIWGLHLKGPVYVVIFKPLSIAIAAFMSAIFLGDALHLGSVIGAVILSTGFYAVIWGKAKEEDMTDDDSGLNSLGNLPNNKIPLLHWPLLLFPTAKNESPTYRIALSSFPVPPQPPPPVLDITFFGVTYKTGNLKTQLLHGGPASELEFGIRKRIMSFLNASKSEYFMVFTANKTLAFKLVAESYPFQSNRKLVLVYDYESEAIEL